jgi:hypothetical protein
MSKKKVKRRDSQFTARSMRLLERDGLHALLPGSPPSPGIVDDMTRRYQQEIRTTPLWDEMVRELGEKEAERLLSEFGVEIR